MDYPLIDQDNTFPRESICPICGVNKVFEPHNFVVLDAGALREDGQGNSINDQNMKGYFNLIWHGNHYDEEEDDNERDQYINLEIVKESSYGQSSFYFCSTECLRKFFNKMVDDFEHTVHRTKKNK